MLEQKKSDRPTRITRLVMHGFKSFARKTELLFGEQYNVVLGPNGSGKSNVLDAICFVLGRLSSKSLRAEKSANLIYNGGKTKQPADKAEVSIYFDNTHHTFPSEEKEIKITRLVRKDGASIYKINDKKRTRQQVLEIMSAAKIDPEGYNIILQGDIIRFVSMSTLERRQVLEEISGISIYEDKKQKALNELDKVESSLKEAEIILTERETYLKELKKERDQAVKYKEAKERIDSCKATVLNSQLTAKQTEKKALDSTKESHQQKFDKFTKDIMALRQKIEQKRQEVEDITKEIELKGEKEQVAIMKELEQLRVEIATNSTKVENYKQELQKIADRRQQLKSDSQDLTVKTCGLSKRIQELEKKNAQIKKEQDQIEAAIEKFKKSNNLGNIPEIESQIQEIDKKSEEKQELVQKLRQEQQDMLREKDRTEFQLKTLDERLDKVKEVAKEHERELDQLTGRKTEFKKVTLELNKCLAEDSSLAAQLRKTRDDLTQNREQLSKLQARSFQITESISANIAVKKILEQKSKMPGIFGTVAELGKVQSKYSLALEIAAGPRLNNIVVRDDKVAALAISYLKSQKLGTATFLPLNKLREMATKPELKTISQSRGSHGVAVALVQFDPQFKKVFNYLFANTIVVDDIDVARRIGIGKAKMVTLDGDIAELSGAMTGGFRKKRPGLGFREEETTKGITELETKTQKLADLADILEKRREENEELIQKLRGQKAELEGEIIKTEKSLHLESGDTSADKGQKQQLAKQLQDVDEKIKQVNQSIQQCNKEFADIKAGKQELRVKISQLQNPALLAELNTLEEKRAELKDESIQTTHQITSIQMQIKDMFGPELEKIDKILKQVDKDEEQFKKEITSITTKITKDQVLLKEMDKKQKQFYEKFKELFGTRDATNKEAQKFEGDKIRVEEQSRQTELKMNNIALKNAAVTAELAGLEKEYEQYHGISLVRNKDTSSLKAEITRFETLVIQMGNINLKALEVYEAVAEEYKNLIKKKDKLSSEKEEVLKLMDEVEQRKGELFMRTFDSVNEHFKRIFSMLTTKGTAYLMLETPENPFEGGVRIRVRIQGKRFLDIRGLSGGEKTLTALAFIFSIQEHEPATFYVLDEVDAALDKHNSEKLARLVRKYSTGAQYIIISHNDAIISESDNLYGVSMDEHSISKVVSLKV
ncbi:MAG: chromosome segregation protein SMC [Candidatus Woesearchaeota archaeon]